MPLLMPLLTLPLAPPTNVTIVAAAIFGRKQYYSRRYAFIIDQTNPHLYLRIGGVVDKSMDFGLGGQRDESCQRHFFK